jgi:hypothetical protein
MSAGRPNAPIAPARRPGLFSLFLDGLRRVVRVPALFACAVVTYLFGVADVSFGSALGTLASGVNGRVEPVTVGLVLLWGVTWAFLWGGIISRYASHPTARARGFFAACVAHVGELTRLTLLAAMAWLVLVWLVTPLAFEPSGRVRRPPTPPGAPESVAALLTPAIVLYVALFCAIYLSLQLARVRAVVEDRRSALFAVMAGWRLLAARPMVVMGLALLSGALFLALLWVLLFLMALNGDSAWRAPLEGLLGGGYLVVSLWAELQVAASLVALYEAEMARGAPAWHVAHAPPLVSGMKTSLAKE